MLSATVSMMMPNASATADAASVAFRTTESSGEVAFGLLKAAAKSVEFGLLK